MKKEACDFYTAQFHRPFRRLMKILLPLMKASVLALLSLGTAFLLLLSFLEQEAPLMLGVGFCIVVSTVTIGVGHYILLKYHGRFQMIRIRVRSNAPPFG